MGSPRTANRGPALMFNSSSKVMRFTWAQTSSRDVVLCTLLAEDRDVRLRVSAAARAT
jgi:hypothetical protein